MKEKYKLGVIYGRFQILHNDHVKYILAGKGLCNHLVIGITNPDPEMTKYEDVAPNRSLLISNPLTYYERYVMIREVMKENYVKYEEYSIAPLPINHPHLIKCYMPVDAVYFLTIHNDWDKKKLETFKSLDLKAHVLWERPPGQKGIIGSFLRRLIAKNQPWEHLVPLSVAELIKKWKIAGRLQSLLT